MYRRIFGRWMWVELNVRRMELMTLGVQYRFLGRVSGSRRARRQVVLCLLWLRVGFQFEV